MNLQSLARNARLYARAEGLVAEIRLRLLARKLVLSILAVAISLLGLVFVNLALFNYLETAWGPVWTPLALGLANLALAVPVLLFASAAKPSPELAMAEDLRKAAAAALEANFHTGQNLADSLGGLTGESNAARLLIPTIGFIISALRRKKPAAK
ncbi:MAG: hypothetical protein WCE69_07775 [Aestuariivirga sp.]